MNPTKSVDKLNTNLLKQFKNRRDLQVEMIIWSTKIDIHKNVDRYWRTQNESKKMKKN